MSTWSPERRGAKPPSLTPERIIESFASRMMYSVARDRHTASDFDAFQALALSVRDRLMERWFETQSAYYEADAKRVYYLSLEFLLGRLLNSNILNLGARDEYSEAMRGIGLSLDQLAEAENDAGLGNGGLGRLAACFTDSAATLSLPFYGYGIRYEYGIFRQVIVNGEQTEAPDAWLQYANPWEVTRADIRFRVKFFGRVERYTDDRGRSRVRWVDTQDVYAMASDFLVPGFRNATVNSLRLWAAKSTRDFDLAKFNAGEYVGAVEDKFTTENISKVLYPPDDQYAGRELRLKQQYFFTSATIQDVIRRFKKRAARRHDDLETQTSHWDDLPEKVAIQLNDTHPAIAIPEMMRVLVDQEALEWEQAWWICERIFGYTNHTVLPEALESWPSELLARLLPRHMQIIEEIERRFRASILSAYPGDEARVKRMAIINDFTGNVRMSHLAIVGSHAVNGVAQLHTNILKTTTFPDFHQMWPRKFINETNGVTPRRWLLQANPDLSKVITEAIGDGWMKDLGDLRGLESVVNDPAFRASWRKARRNRKIALANWLRRSHRMEIDPETFLDVQIKRIHEYKRQLLNVLHVVALYHRIIDGDKTIARRTVVFAGKAAPSYRIAKQIIALIHRVGALVRSNPLVAQTIDVLFIPNYGVTAAEKLFPATDLSEQISTAGTEASGTGCMKATLNGAVLMATLDGANIEIRDAVGAENIFIFGHTNDELVALRERGYDPHACVSASPELGRVIETIRALDGGRFHDLTDLLTSSDRYFHCADFDSFVAMQKSAADAWRDDEAWTTLSILNCARSGRFSADRTVAEYAREIWKIEPVAVELPTGSPVSVVISDR